MKIRIANFRKENSKILKNAMLILLVLSTSIVFLLSFIVALRINPLQIYNDLEFDGQNGHLLLNASFARQKIREKGISIAVWAMIYPQEQQGQNPIIGLKEYQFYLDGESDNGTKFTWIVWNDSNYGIYAISPEKFQFFTWYFVVGTWDANSGKMSLYVNGERISQANGPTSLQWKTDEWIVGKSGNNYSLYGRISNLQMYFGALPPEDIMTLFNRGRKGTALLSQDVLGWWSFDGNFFNYDNKNNFQPFGDVNWIQSSQLIFPYDILSLIATYSLVTSILALLPHFPLFNTMTVFASLRKKFPFYVTIIFLKSSVAMLTPLSLDFLNILHTSSFSTPPIGVSPQEGGFWFLVVYVFSSLWNFSPVSHPNMQALFRQPFDIYYNRVPPPAGAYLIPFFFGEGASGLFAWVLLAKLPYILLDVGIALVIYKIVLKLKNSEKIAISSLFLWLLNPLSILLIEMFTSNDALMVLFFLSSIYYLMNDKKLQSALFYGLSVAVRLIPILFLPFMLYIYSRKSIELKKTSAIDSLKQKLTSVFKFLQFLSVMIFVFIAVNLPMFFVANLPLISDPAESPSALLLAESYHFFFGITFHSPLMNLYGFRFGVTIILFVIALLFVIQMWGSKKMNMLDSLLILFLVLFTFSNWNPQYWLWVMPLIIIKIKLAPEYKSIFSLQLFLFLLINITLFGYYYSTWGKSFFFFPNYNGSLQLLSSFMFSIFNNPLVIGLRLDELLISIFAGVTIWIILKQIWSCFKGFS